LTRFINLSGKRPINFKTVPWWFHDQEAQMVQKPVPAKQPHKAGKRRSYPGGKRPPSFRLGLPLALLALVAFLLAVQLSPGGWSKAWALIRPAQPTAAPTTSSTTGSAVTTVPGVTGTTNLAPTPTQLPPTATPEPTPTPLIDITLAVVGDVILHQSVIEGGLVQAGGTTAYDYTPAFQYIKPIIAAADLAFANYEGTLAGPPYKGYPFFCAPDEIADALFDTGFRVVWTANNHTLDRGLAGVIRTATVFRDREFYVIGTRPDEASRTDQVVSVKGYKLGLMAYTFETIGTETQKALNGIPMPAAADPLIDSFNPYRSDAFERDMAALLDRAEVLRGEGAEIICLSLHWGNEYQTKSSSFQRKMAQRLADAGIELIIGHHPHVLQEIDVLTAADGKSRTLVFYSISNILHNMDFNTHNTKGFAQDAVIARITISRTDGLAQVTGADYIPTFVTRVPRGSGTQHLIVPVLEALEDPAAWQSARSELEASLSRIRSVLSGSTGTEAIPVREAVPGGAP
jgi:poly-gamma-glutamate synthesis protein (capsule biosynthesis protein)